MSRLIAFRLPDDLTTDFYAKLGERKTTATETLVQLVRVWVHGLEPAPARKSTLATDAQIAARKAARNPVAASVPLITDVQRKPYQKTGKRK